MSTSWQLREVDGSRVAALAGALGVLPITARCLLARGVTDAGVGKDYLDPRLGSLRPPEGLAGLDVAVSRLARAVARGERIGVFGDYDVDGVTSAALLASFLGQCGVTVTARVANRASGYGFGVTDARGFADARCSLIVTCDCGTSDLPAIAEANARGIDVIVIDHHTVPAQGDDAPPHPALALINPHRVDSRFPFRGMASVGLSFYVAAKLRTELRRNGTFNAERSAPDVRSLLDLVALGTIADMVPLVQENRILASWGLRELARSPRPGLAALLRRAELTPGEPITEQQVSWRLGPRLNAPGRLGEADPALRLMLARTPVDAERWADVLEDANETRRALQDDVYRAAREQLDGQRDPGAALVVAGEGWPHGVVGIVAAKLVKEYGRPVFAIAIDAATGEGRGSARTCGDVDLYAALERCGEHLVRFGGHKGAAGLTVHRDRIPALRDALRAAVMMQQSAAAEAAARADLLADAEVGLIDVGERLVDELSRLAPFGVGNEAPLLVCRGLRVRESRRVGEDGGHLKVALEDAAGAQCNGIAFGQGERDPGQGATIDVAFEPTINEWQGRRRVELTIRGLAVS